MFVKKWFDNSKPIIVAGDSHTYGQGHDEGIFDPFKNPPSTKAWPNYIWSTDQFNNIASSGNSNGDITQSIYEHWHDNVKIVCVMFTHFNRRDFSFNGDSYTFLPSGIQYISNSVLEHERKKNIHANKTELFADFQKMFTLQQSDVGDYLNFLKNVIAIQNLCTSNQCKFFWCTLENIQKSKILTNNPYTDWQISRLEKLVHWQNYFTIKNNSLTEYAETIPGNVSTACGHYTVEVHKLWGSHFQTFINTINETI